MKTRYLFCIITLLSIFYYSEIKAQSINTIEITDLRPGWKDWHYADYTNSVQANFATCDTAGNIYYTTSTKIIKINALTGVRTTIAGQSYLGYGGDMGFAKDAVLSNPMGLVIDKSNNIIFVDQSNYRIRKINQTSGIIETIGGSGVNGYSGDGALAINAKIGQARGIDLDTAGNILFTDHYYCRIRKINVKTGIISTFAGTFRGPASTTPIAANLATFSTPYDLKVNNKNDVFILDRDNYRIRRIDGITNLVSIYAGSDSSVYTDGVPATNAHLDNATSICFDESYNLYVTNLYTLKRINQSDNRIFHLVGKLDSVGFNGDENSLKETLLYTESVTYNPKTKKIILNDNGNYRLREISFTQSTPIADRNVTFCLKGPSRQLTATGTNLKWYSSAIGGSYSLIAPTIYTNIQDTFVYFVSQTTGGIEGPRASVVARVFSVDTAKVWDRNLQVCNGADMISVYQNIWIDKAPIYYYLFRDRTLLDSIPETPIPEKLNSGKQKFYFLIKNDFGCYSPMDSVELFVKEKLPLPDFKSPTNICQWDAEFYPQAKGTNLLWYIDTLNDGLEFPPKTTTGSVKTVYYYLRQMDSSYCFSDYGIMQVNVKPKPKEIVKVISPVEYCQGDEADAFSAVGPNLAWYSQDSVFLGRTTPKASTKEAGKNKTLVCVQNEFGCKGSFSEINTTINPKPIISSTVDLIKPYTGIPVTLNSVSDIGKTYNWNTGDSISTIIFTPKNEGRYYFWVQSTSEFGCKSDTSWQYVDILPSEYWNSDYEVHPNPFKNNIRLTNVNLQDIISVNLYSLNGIKVFQSELPLKSLEILIPENLTSGYYLLEINTVGHAHPTRLLFKE